METYFVKVESVLRIFLDSFVVREKKREKNRKQKQKQNESVLRKLQLKIIFESWKVKFLCSKSRVKLEILNQIMGHLFFLSTVVNHLASVLQSAYAKQFSSLPYAGFFLFRPIIKVYLAQLKPWLRFLSYNLVVTTKQNLKRNSPNNHYQPDICTQLHKIVHCSLPHKN